MKRVDTIRMESFRYEQRVFWPQTRLPCCLKSKSVWTHKQPCLRRPWSLHPIKSIFVKRLKICINQAEGLNEKLIQWNHMRDILREIKLLYPRSRLFHDLTMADPFYEIDNHKIDISNRIRTFLSIDRQFHWNHFI